MTLTLLPGDALTQLRKLPAASVHLCMTSPPYLGLRRYSDDPAMIGLEPTWAEHLEALLAVFGPEGVMRVLRPDGLLVVNYADKYGAGGRKNHGPDKKAPRRPFAERDPGSYGLGLPDKCLLLLPERLAIAMTDAGWILRAKAPWVKMNGLPDSAPDRPGMNLEHVYMFAHPESINTQFWTHRDRAGTRTPPEPDYRWVHPVSGEESTEPRGKPWKRINLWEGHNIYWDAEAVRKTYAPGTLARYEQAERNGGQEIEWTPPGQTKTGIRRETAHSGRSRRMGDWWVESVREIVGCEHTDTADGSWHGTFADGRPERRDSSAAPKGQVRKKQDEHPSRIVRGMNDRWDAAEAAGRVKAGPKSNAKGGMVLSPAGEPLGLYLPTQGFNGLKLLADFFATRMVPNEDGELEERELAFVVNGACPHHGKNAVRTFAGECCCTPIDVDHFATYPERLVEPFVLAGTSAKGCCPACGAPWVRVVEKDFEAQEDVSLERGVKGAAGQKPMDESSSWGGVPRGSTVTHTTGWRPGCECPEAAQPAPCTVLDPFLGAGTTLLVADRHGRNGVGIELKPEYVTMARRRFAKEAPLLHGEAR